MKSGNPRHISIEKRGKKKPKANVTEQSKETKMSLTLGFSPITYYPMKHIGQVGR